MTVHNSSENIDCVIISIIDQKHCQSKVYQMLYVDGTKLNQLDL